jgi:hypothetical protein
MTGHRRLLCSAADISGFLQASPEPAENGGGLEAKYLRSEWLTATEVLIMAAESRGPLMHARIGISPGIEPRRRAGIQDAKMPVCWPEMCIENRDRQATRSVFAWEFSP